MLERWLSPLSADRIRPTDETRDVTLLDVAVVLTVVEREQATGLATKAQTTSAATVRSLQFPAFE